MRSDAAPKPTAALAEIQRPPPPRIHRAFQVVVHLPSVLYCTGEYCARTARSAASSTATAPAMQCCCSRDCHFPMLAGSLACAQDVTEGARSSLPKQGHRVAGISRPPMMRCPVQAREGDGTGCAAMCITTILYLGTGAQAAKHRTVQAPFQGRSENTTVHAQHWSLGGTVPAIVRLDSQKECLYFLAEHRRRVTMRRSGSGRLVPCPIREGLPARPPPFSRGHPPTHHRGAHLALNVRSARGGRQINVTGTRSS